MDDIDQRIIEMLLDNSRQSYVEMGKQLGLSRVAVRERVRTLLEEGVIEGFTVTLNQEKYGRNISAFFDIEVETSYLESVANLLAEEPYVVSIYQMTGPSTLHVHAVLEDMKALEAFIYKKLYSLNGITRVENQILLRRFKSRGGVRP